MNQNAQYSDATRDSLQRIFGKGFTSPGGREEMARLLDGLDLTGQTVMDLGCGLGGDSLLLGGPFGAGKVVSVDVDPGNLDVTGRAVREAGLEDVIAPTLVDPGPMPFPDGSFDVVHSKAMISNQLGFTNASLPAAPDQSADYLRVGSSGRGIPVWFPANL